MFVIYPCEKISIAFEWWGRNHDLGKSAAENMGAMTIVHMIDDRWLKTAKTKILNITCGIDPSSSKPLN